MKCECSKKERRLKEKNNIGDDATTQCNVDATCNANWIKCSYVGKELKEEELKVTKQNIDNYIYIYKLS